MKINRYASSNNQQDAINNTSCWLNQHLKMRHSSSLSNSAFYYFQSLIFKHAGIHISKDKKGMLEIRLNKRLKALRLTTFEQYKKYLHLDHCGVEIINFINAITTNKTDFFREDYHYKFLKDHIETNHINENYYIWSAACSSGEEAYSLAMLCEEISITHSFFNYSILATDVDTNRLQMASKGIYEKNSIENIPSQLRRKYCSTNKKLANDEYVLADKLKHKIKFRHHNLTHYQKKFAVKFHSILIRNVLYYFTKSVAENVAHTLVSQLQPGGLIFVSLTEKLNFTRLGLIQVGSSVYQKPLSTSNK